MNESLVKQSGADDSIPPTRVNEHNHGQGSQDDNEEHKNLTLELQKKFMERDASIGVILGKDA